MIVVKLYGGLGNQMFQYAAGLGLAKRLKTNVYVDLTWIRETAGTSDVTNRPFELGIFGIHERKKKLPERASLLYSGLKFFKENGFEYNPGINDLCGNVYLDGHWASYRYFLNAKKEVQKAFTFPQKTSSKNQEMLKQIKNSASVSIHVRRGDYVSNKEYSKYFGQLSSGAYYKEAVELINKRVENPHFYVFSDDPTWCKKNLNLGEKITFVDHNPPDKGYEDMHLMSVCQHNIIANSTFSWWGAWLNTNPGKIVMAPKLWFLDTGMNDKDLIPEEWTRL